MEIIKINILNESYNHYDRYILEKHICKTDIQIFVMNCMVLCLQNEIDVLEKYFTPLEYDNIIFLLNRYNQVRDKDKQKVCEYAEYMLTKYTYFKENEIIPISLLDAHQGILQKNHNQVESSGFVNFEELLKKSYIKRKNSILNIILPNVKSFLTELNSEVIQQQKNSNKIHNDLLRIEHITKILNFVPKDINRLSAEINKMES